MANNQRFLPFEDMYDEDNRYHYFDLRIMTQNLLFTKDECLKAKKLIDSGKVRLQQLQMGYPTNGEGHLEGVATGLYRKSFDRDRAKAV